jgi:hypothetical protein
VRLFVRLAMSKRIALSSPSTSSWSRKGVGRMDRAEAIRRKLKEARKEIRWLWKIMAACHDCGMKYGGADWRDTVLPDDQWDLICPEGGILCANCIIKRAAKVPGVCYAKMQLMDANDTPYKVALTDMRDAMKQEGEGNHA